MYSIRPANGLDIEELVVMYVDLLENAYPTRRIAPRAYLYQIVVNWILNEERVMIVEKDHNIIGFSLTLYNNAGGATETVLDAAITYIKKEFRKSKGAYIIYNDVFDFAKQKGLAIFSTSTPESSPIVTKRFGASLTFNHFEVSKEYIDSQHK